MSVSHTRPNLHSPVVFPIELFRISQLRTPEPSLAGADGSRRYRRPLIRLRSWRSKSLIMSSSSPRTALARGSKKKNKKKGVKGSDPTAKLTDDLLVEVISRVPYKSICCCKCVSTRWRDLISHPDHRKKMPHSLAGFLYESYNADRLPRKARNFINESGKGGPFIDPSLSFLPKYQSLDILDGCNGLLLCRCWKATDPKTLDYIVCNPVTEKWVVVPATDWSCKVSVARLGFDPAVSSHFHVFEFIKQKTWGIDDEELSHWDDEYIVALAIYSSKAGAWKHQTGSDPFEIPENATSAFFNGIMHFAVCDDLMVVVDPEGDNWWRFPIPMKTTNVRTSDIFPSQGQLYFASNTLYCDDTPTELDVWVLENYDTGSWTLKHSVSHLQLLGRKYLPYMDDYSIISIHPEHNLIFIVCGHEKTLMSYDIDSGERCDISQLGWDCRPPYVPYVPLFSESLGDGH